MNPCPPRDSGVYMVVYNQVYNMSEVVSVRVRKEVKDTLEKAGIDVAGKTREYLEELAWETRTASTLAELRELSPQGRQAVRQGVIGEADQTRQGCP